MFLSCRKNDNSSNNGEEICTPACSEGRCGDDGCGGECPCPTGTECGEDGLCREPDQCDILERECGTINGVGCGTCDSGFECERGVCVCVPDCGDNECGEDGCGGTCDCPGDTQTARGTDSAFDDTDICEETCADLEYECDELCGQSCGECVDDEQCSVGLCICTPVCDGTHCGDNGCGGNCDCEADLLCNAEHACVAEAECGDTCGSAGAVCGTICGETCGTCNDNEGCAQGACVEAASCDDCPLVLSLVEMRMQGEQLDQIVLAVDYNPREDDPRARMLELFLRTTPAMELTSAEEGAAMTDAGKSLSINSDTGNPWTETSRGIYRFVAYTMSNTTDFSPGRLLTLTFTTSANVVGTTVQFAFQKQSQTFAPEEADLLLQLSPYDTPVQVLVQ